MSFGNVTGFAVTDSQKCVGDVGFIAMEVDGKPKTVADVRGAVLQWIGKNKLTISADAVVRDLNAGMFIQCAGHSLKIVNSSMKVGVDKAGEQLKIVGRSAYGLPKGATDAEVTKKRLLELERAHTGWARSNSSITPSALREKLLRQFTSAEVAAYFSKHGLSATDAFPARVFRKRIG